MEIADNLGKAAAEVKAGLLRSMRSVMSTVKRAAGYEEENQQAEQIANEMFQVKRVLSTSNRRITEIIFSNIVGEIPKHLQLQMKNSK